MRRLFRWLKDKGVTAVVTGERGDGLLTRQGLEEYVSDAVTSLPHLVHEVAAAWPSQRHVVPKTGGGRRAIGVMIRF